MGRTKTDIENSYFDYVEFGAVVRENRLSMQMESVEFLSKLIEARTGVKISAGTLYRIESGKTPVTVSQLAAICTTLFLDPFPEFLSTRCASLAMLEAQEEIKSYENRMFFTLDYARYHHDGALPSLVDYCEDYYHEQEDYRESYLLSPREYEQYIKGVERGKNSFEIVRDCEQ